MPNRKSTKIHRKTKMINAPGKILEGRLSKKYDSDAGQDIHASEDITIYPFSNKAIPTGLKIAVPSGFVGLVWPRSGSSFKASIETGAGVIDEDYRGYVNVKLYNHGDKQFNIKSGDRIAQLLTIPCDNRAYEPVEELADTERGENGFGSTGV